MADQPSCMRTPGVHELRAMQAMRAEARQCDAQLADALISPTHYMTAFLRERAWRLPKTSLVIPNVLPPAPTGQPALKVSQPASGRQSLYQIDKLHYMLMASLLAPL